MTGAVTGLFIGLAIVILNLIFLLHLGSSLINYERYTLIMAASASICAVAGFMLNGFMKTRDMFSIHYGLVGLILGGLNSLGMKFKHGYENLPEYS